MSLFQQSGGVPSGIGSVTIVGISSVQITSPTGQQLAVNSIPVVLNSDPDLRANSGTITAADVASNLITGQSGIGIATGAPSAGSSYSINTNGQSSVVFTLGGTFSATLVFDLSYNNGLSFIANCPAILLSTQHTLYSVTGQGSFLVNCAGATQVSVRCTSYVSGTVIVTPDASSALGITYQDKQGYAALANPANWATTDWTSGSTPPLPNNPRTLWVGIATGASCTIKLGLYNSNVGVAFTTVQPGYWPVPVYGISTIYSPANGSIGASNLVVLG